jgi:predicted nucleic acid-binding protein
MLLLDTSFLIEFEDEVLRRRPAAASAILGAHRHMPVGISIVALGEFAEGFTDPVAFNAFASRFQVIALSRAIVWRCAQLQQSLSRRLGENDAWIAATALTYNATLVARERAFSRVPRLRVLAF